MNLHSFFFFQYCLSIFSKKKIKISGILSTLLALTVENHLLVELSLNIMDVLIVKLITINKVDHFVQDVASLSLGVVSMHLIRFFILFYFFFIVVNIYNLFSFSNQEMAP